MKFCFYDTIVLFIYGLYKFFNFFDGYIEKKNFFIFFRRIKKKDLN